MRTLASSDTSVNADLIQVVLLPQQHVRALGAGPSPTRGRVVTLREAMEQPWDFDGHVQRIGYNGRHNFRIGADAVKDPKTGHYTTVTWGHDFDPPKGVLVDKLPTAEWRADVEARLARLHQDHPGVLITRTWKGYHVDAILPEAWPLNCETYKQTHVRMHAIGIQLRLDYGLEYDRAACDPTRMFRVPRALREDGKDYRPFEPLFGTTMGVASIAVSDRASGEAMQTPVGRSIGWVDRQKQPNDFGGVARDHGLQDIDLISRPGGAQQESESFMRFILGSLGRLYPRSPGGSWFRCPFSQYHGSNTDGTSATTLIGGTCHCSHAHSGAPEGLQITSATIKSALLAEYLACPGVDEKLSLASYDDLDRAVDLYQVRGRPTVTILSSPPGSGKTTAARRLAEGGSVLVIQPNIRLANDLAADFGIPSYQDGVVAGSLSITTDSLHKLSPILYGSDYAWGTVFIDELGSSLRSIFGMTQRAHGTCYLNWRALKHIIETHGSVLAADATMTASDIAILRRLVPDVYIRRVIATGAETRFAGTTLEHLPDAATAHARVLELVNGTEGPVAALTTSRTWGLATMDRVVADGHRAMARFGGMSAEEDVPPDQVGAYRLVTLTPAAAKGVSYTVPFGGVVCNIPYDPGATCGGLGAPTVIQLMSRIRNNQSDRIYASVTSRSAPTALLSILNLSLREAAELGFIDSDVFFTCGFDADFHEANVISRKAEIAEGHNVKAWVNAYYEGAGMQVQDAEAKADPAVAAQLKQAKAQYRDRAAREVADAESVVPSRSRPATRAARLAQTKAKIRAALDAPVTAQVVAEYDDRAAVAGNALAAVVVAQVDPGAVAGRSRRAAGPNALRLNEVDRARAVRDLLTRFHLGAFTVAGEAAPEVGVLVMKAGNLADFYSKNRDRFAALKLPVGRTPRELLTLNMRRLGLPLTTTPHGTLTVAPEAWDRAWRWATPAVDRMLGRLTVDPPEAASVLGDYEGDLGP